MSTLRSVARHFLPGCPHEAAHVALAAAIEASGLSSRVVGVAGVGCGSLAANYLDVPFVASPAGRGVSVARGLLTVRRDLLPVVYGGDGELLGEGLSDLIRAAVARAPLLVALVDNHMQARSARVHSSTTALGEVLPSCPAGRDPVRHGHPLDPAALLGSLGVTLRVVEASDGPGLQAAFREGLAKVSARHGLAVVQVCGECRGEPGGER